jgi:hypothetical protein
MISLASLLALDRGMGQKIHRATSLMGCMLLSDVVQRTCCRSSCRSASLSRLMFVMSVADRKTEIEDQRTGWTEIESESGRRQRSDAGEGQTAEVERRNEDISSE